MSELKITVDQIKELMAQMEKTNLGSLSIEVDGFKLKLAAKKPQEKIAALENVLPVQPINTVVQTPADGLPAAAQKQADGHVVEAPIVGTFYAAPSPDQPAFVTVGKEVKKGDVLFIIESMKLMNEIQSDFDGVVTEIFAKDGDPVEYGQPILTIE